LLVPGHLASVSARTPIDCDEGYPIPLGIISFETEVVQRLHKVVFELLEGSRDMASYIDWESTSIVSDIESALRRGPA
jgi:hypothetical protein